MTVGVFVVDPVKRLIETLWDLTGQAVDGTMVGQALSQVPAFSGNQATRDKVYGVLESVYKSRNPEDAEAAGLQAVIDAKK